MCFVNRHNRAFLEYLRIGNRAGECHTARVVSIIMVDNVIKRLKKTSHLNNIFLLFAKTVLGAGAVLGDNQSRHQIPSVNLLSIITLL